MVLAFRNKARQLGQRHFIDTAFELHHHIQWNPVIVPTPGVELRGGGGAQVQIPIVAPATGAGTRFVSGLVMSARIAADVPVRHLVAQPIRVRATTRTWSGISPTSSWSSRNIACSGTRPGRCLAGTASWVRMRLPPEHLVLVVEQDDADVRAKAVPVKHNQTPNFKTVSIMHGAHDARQVGAPPARLPVR